MEEAFGELEKKSVFPGTLDSFCEKRLGTILYYVCQVFYDFFQPFCLGMNSILLYLGHGTAWQMFPFNYTAGPMNTHYDRRVPPKKY